MKKIIWAGVILSASAVLTIAPETAAQAVKNALVLCSRSVIPSVFPFLVLSEITVRTGAVSSVSPVFRPLGRLLGLSDCGAAVFILGNLCGFPVGASAAAQTKRDGKIGSREAQRLASIANNVSTGFAVSYAGMSVIGDKSIGIALYVCQLTAAAAIGIATRGKHRENSAAVSKSENDSGNAFVSSVAAAAGSTLNIAAFVMIFSVISSYISAICTLVKAPLPLTAFLICIAEITNGCKYCTALPFEAKIALVAFALGFSGISVICQSAVFLKKENIRILPVAVMKLIQGALTSLFALAYIKIFPPAETVFAPAENGFDIPIFMSGVSIFLVIAYIFCFFHIRHLNKRLDLYNKISYNK